MSTILVIGAGGVGGVITQKLVKEGHHVVLASRGQESIQNVVTEVNLRTGKQISTWVLDADEPDQLDKAFLSVKPDLCVHVAQPYQNLTIMDACLRHGCDYLDTANYEPRDQPKFEYSHQWAYKEKFESAGLTCILGCGFDPGVTGVMTAFLAKEYFDEITSLQIVDVNAGSHGHYFATNFNTETNLREILALCQHYEDRSLIVTERMSCKSTFQCPENAGNHTVYRLHHEELESLHKNYPTLQTAEFYMSFGDQYLKCLDVLEGIGMTSINPVSYQGLEIAPIKFLESILPKPSTLGAKTVGKTCIGVIVSGVKDGKPAPSQYMYNISDHQECFYETGAQAISYTTAIPAVAGALQILSGAWKRAGVFNVEELPPEPFLDELDRLGLPCVITSNVPTLEKEVN